MKKILARIFTGRGKCAFRPLFYAFKKASIFRLKIREFSSFGHFIKYTTVDFCKLCGTQPVLRSEMGDIY